MSPISTPRSVTPTGSLTPAPWPQSAPSVTAWDNSAAESFWSTFKTEFYDRHHWATKSKAKTASGRWIEERYNRRRRHSSIGMLTPILFEKHQLQTAQAA